MSPLSELVWSPDEGLSIQIAASSLSTRKASLRWNSDTLNIVLSSPQQSGGSGTSGNNIDATLVSAREMPSQLRTCTDSSVRVSMASPDRIQNLDVQQSTSVRSLEQDSKSCGGIKEMNGGKELSANCCVDKSKKEEEPTRSCADASQSLASRKEVKHTISEKQVNCATTVHNEISLVDNAWRARLVQAISQKDYVLPNNAVNAQLLPSFGNFGNAKNVTCKLINSLGNNTNDSHQNQIIQENHSDNIQDQVMQENQRYEPIIAKWETTSGVNLVPRCESAFGVNSVARYASTSGVNSTKLEKGKEKVMKDQSHCVSNTKEGDDSNESMESCPSTQAPKREYAQCSTAEMSFRNKRCKNEYNDSSCSGLLHRNGSSFFNWMSSLTNGSRVLNNTIPGVSFDEKFSAATGHDYAEHYVPPQNNSTKPLQSVSFNSLFKSLYCRNVMITSGDACHRSERNCTEHESNRLASNSIPDKQISMEREALNVTTENLATDCLQMDSVGGRGNFRNPIRVSPLRAGRNLKLPNSGNSCSRSLEKNQNECLSNSLNAATGNKGGFRESLWVSRLLPKTSTKLIDATMCNVKSDFRAANPKDTGDKLYCSSQHNFNAEKEFIKSQYFTSTGSANGTTRSKCPAIPSEEHKQLEMMSSILARRLDALRHAKASAGDHRISKEHNHRTSSFVVSYRSHDRLEAGQETHKSSSGDGKLVLWPGDKRNRTGSDEELRGKVLPRGEHRNRGGSTAGVAVSPRENLKANTSDEDADRRGIKMKEVMSNSMESQQDNKQIVPYGTMSNDACDQASVIFGALQRLRLSRTEIIRWLKSPVMHTTLDGFYLRLRFGKWEEALGGTGYHVARINGALDRNSLSVTIRHSTCQVDSRFVSNHNFNEDELKAWWSAAMKDGWKLPSVEELSKKLRERELLHLQNGTGQHNGT